MGKREKNNNYQTSLVVAHDDLLAASCTAKT